MESFWLQGYCQDGVQFRHQRPRLAKEHRGHLNVRLRPKDAPPTAQRTHVE